MFTSIQEAIDAAPKHATIQIGPGLFHERLTISKPITLAGAGWERTVISMESKAFELQQRYKELTKGAVADAQEIAMSKDFEAEIKQNQYYPTIFVCETKAVEIRDLRLSAPGQGAKRAPRPGSILAFRKAKCSVRSCALIDSPASGIMIADDSTVDISDCLIAAVRGAGIDVGWMHGKNIKARITDSDVRTCEDAGIHIAPSNHVAIERCRISGAQLDGIRYKDASPSIIGNLFFDNNRSGIYASGKTAAMVKNNVFYRNAMNGISCSKQNRDRIDGNTFAKNLQEGLAVIDASEPIIRRNVFWSHPVAITCRDFRDEPKVMHDPEFEQNLFWENENHVTRASMERDIEDVVLSMREEEGNLVADPCFLSSSESAPDFTMMAGSVAAKHGMGASNPLSFRSPWPLQPEEQAIILTPSYHKKNEEDNILAWSCLDTYMPPDPAYLPDDPEGGKALDELYDAVDKDARPADEVVRTVRNGLRRTKHDQGDILRWFGNRFICGKDPQLLEAIELMYHATSLNRKVAINFGLLPVKYKSPNILKVLTDIAMTMDDPNDLDEIALGCDGNEDSLIYYLEPYLRSDDETMREKAKNLERIFNGELRKS